MTTYQVQFRYTGSDAIQFVNGISWFKKSPNNAANYTVEINDAFRCMYKLINFYGIDKESVMVIESEGETK